MLTLVPALLISRYDLQSADEPFFLAIGNPDYFSLRWYEYFVMIALSVGSTIAAIFFVQRQRSGDSISIVVPLAMWLSAALGVSGSGSVSGGAVEATKLDWGNPSSGPLMAQVRHELRRSSMGLLLTVVMTIGVLALIGLVTWMNPTWGREFSAKRWLAAIVLIPMWSQFMATELVAGMQYKHCDAELSLFDATRPFACDTLMGIKIAVIVGGSLIRFLLVVTVAAVCTSIAGQWHYWDLMFGGIRSWVTNAIQSQIDPTLPAVSRVDFRLQDVSLFWRLIVLLNVIVWHCFTALMLLAFVFWVGKHWRWLVVASFTFLAIVMVFLWDKYNGNSLARICESYSYLVPVTIVLISCYWIAMSVRSGIVGRNYLLGVLCL